MPATQTPTDGSPQTKPWVWVILLVVIVAIGAVILISQSKKGVEAPKGAATPTADQTTPAPTLKVEKKDVPEEQVPEGFPVDIPMEKGAKITQNYNATISDGRVQATRVFETAKSLAENFTLYKDFFSKNGWTILTTLDQPTLKGIGAKKDNLQAQVNIAENSLTHIRTVDIYVTQSPK